MLAVVLNMKFPTIALKLADKSKRKVIYCSEASYMEMALNPVPLSLYDKDSHTIHDKTKRQSNRK